MAWLSPWSRRAFGCKSLALRSWSHQGPGTSQGKTAQLHEPCDSWLIVFEEVSFTRIMTENDQTHIDMILSQDSKFSVKRIMWHCDQCWKTWELEMRSQFQNVMSKVRSRLAIAPPILPMSSHHDRFKRTCKNGQVRRLNEHRPHNFSWIFNTYITYKYSHIYVNYINLYVYRIRIIRVQAFSKNPRGWCKYWVHLEQVPTFQNLTHLRWVTATLRSKTQNGSFDLSKWQPNTIYSNLHHGS